MENCVNPVYFIVRVWKNAMTIFLADFLSLVKNAEKRPLGGEGKV